MSTPREVKVGAFVLLGLFMSGLVVFLIGDERGLFKKKLIYTTTFEDVEGLKRGSPVRMGGVDIGTVDSVAYGSDTADKKLHIRIEIVAEQSPRVREGSEVTIEGKGLLGDKMLVISVGDPEKVPIPPGGEIPGKTSGGLGQLLTRASSITTKADAVMSNLEKGTGVLAEDQFQKDLRATVSSLNAILEKLDTGDGYAGRLLHDPAEADKLSHTLTSLQQTSAELNHTLHGLNTVIDRVQTGPGFAHDVVYGDTGTRTLAQFGGAAEELSTTLRGVREGNGVARTMLFGGGDNAEMVADLTAMSHDLRLIVAGIRQGKGTIGALLVDPSVYEDLKLLLGNVERNRVLRALVRFSIRRDEKTPSVQVRDPEPAPAAGGPSGSASR